MTEVVQVDPENPEIRNSALLLLKQAFGSFPDDQYDHILLGRAHAPALFAVFEAGDMVAMNGFIPHSVHRSGETSIAYQSCLSATRSDQKGKGRFSSIIEYAKVTLKSNGAAFIFGFPNHNSGPIFVKKLGFTISNNAPCLYAPLPLLPIGRFSEGTLLDELSRDGRVYFDAYETARWKKDKHGTSFFEYENATNYMFGYVKQRSFRGFKVKMLVIGGFEINKPLRFKTFLKQALRKARVYMLRVNASSTGPFFAASGMTRDETLTEPTIAFSLNWDVDAADLEAFGGLKDVY